ncbi:MAG: ATP-binding protein [Anaerolineae bacterium]|jgi:DNA replication protein DnaC|nr:ATP-binding protein [Chloroflexota bacterium]
MSDDPNQLPSTPVCEVCGGVGYVRVQVPVGHPLFGKAVPCVCKRQELRERRLARLREDSNLAHLRNMRFDTFTISPDVSTEVFTSLHEALSQAAKFAASPQGWLLFTGDYGSGKTHLAAAIANERIEQGQSALFVVVPDLLDYLRSAYAPNSPSTYNERFEQIRSIPLLILDDLGTQNSTPWAAEKLYQILNYRYNAELPTVITTNQNLTDMEPRLASRLRDRRLVTEIPIYATDARTLGNESFGSLKDYGNYNFDSFSLREGELERSEAQALAHTVQLLRAWAEDPSKWILLRGSYGVGKTHLAAAAANRIATKGMSVLLVVVADLLDHLRATYHPNSPVSYDQRFNEVRRARVLVLDDLGAQNATPWAEEKLFQILNHRYVSRLATIFTVSTDGWENLDPRLRSRMMDADVCTIIDINTPTYRGAVAPKAPPRRTSRQRRDRPSS